MKIIPCVALPFNLGMYLNLFRDILRVLQNPLIAGLMQGEGSIGLFITLVPKVLCFLVPWMNNFGDFY